MNIAKSFLVLACLFVSSSIQAGEWDIDTLMHGLAQTRAGHASFVEKKSIAILDKPVESSGELFYTAPDRLEKRTLKPRPESMVLEQGTLTIEQKGKRHVLPLQNYPEIAAFIESIRGTLAGDRAALERAYHLNLEGGEQGWTLELLPLADRMKKVVERIRIAGERHELRTIEIRQADGDSSLMTITQMSAP
ncbi:MAG: LolA-related protein [Methylophilaceae bacterium]